MSMEQTRLKTMLRLQKLHQYRPRQQTGIQKTVGKKSGSEQQLYFVGEICSSRSARRMSGTPLGYAFQARYTETLIIYDQRDGILLKLDESAVMPKRHQLIATFCLARRSP